MIHYHNVYIYKKQKIYIYSPADAKKHMDLGSWILFDKRDLKNEPKNTYNKLIKNTYNKLIKKYIQQIDQKC